MKKIGIWLDQKEANIITIVGDNVQNKTIFSDIETRERFVGETKKFGRFGDQYLNDEKGKKNRIHELTNKYLNEILIELSDAEEFMLFGPAQTKLKLEKLIYSKLELSSKLKGVQTAENMTENQKIAYVKKYFNF